MARKFVLCPCDSSTRRSSGLNIASFKHERSTRRVRKKVREVLFCSSGSTFPTSIAKWSSDKVASLTRTQLADSKAHSKRTCKASTMRPRFQRAPSARRQAEIAEPRFTFCTGTAFAHAHAALHLFVGTQHHKFVLGYRPKLTS